MNIDGLSEATLEKFIAMGFIHNFGDIFEIGKYKDQIVEMEGFGQKSFDNLMVSLGESEKNYSCQGDLQSWDYRYRSCKCQGDL